MPRSFGYHNKILIEFNYKNKVKRDVDIKKVGGFCIGLSHFKASEKRWTKEFELIIDNRKHKELFIANHLNGYSFIRKKDLHTVEHTSQLNYLKTLLKFLFGKCIALEIFNPIKEQLKFKKYIIKILKDKI